MSVLQFPTSWMNLDVETWGPKWHADCQSHTRRLGEGCPEVMGKQQVSKAIVDQPHHSVSYHQRARLSDKNFLGKK